LRTEPNTESRLTWWARQNAPSASRSIGNSDDNDERPFSPEPQEKGPGETPRKNLKR
jgi:hypothetical protein